MTGDTCKYSLVYIHGPSLASDGEIAALHTGECNLVEFSVVVRWIRESENFLDSTACCGLYGVLLLYGPPTGQLFQFGTATTPSRGALHVPRNTRSAVNVATWRKDHESMKHLWWITRQSLEKIPAVNSVNFADAFVASCKNSRRDGGLFTNLAKLTYVAFISSGAVNQV